jgi:hypothetical protein
MHMKSEALVDRYCQEDRVIEAIVACVEAFISVENVRMVIMKTLTKMKRKRNESK